MSSSPSPVLFKNALSESIPSLGAYELSLVSPGRAVPSSGSMSSAPARQPDLAGGVLGAAEGHDGLPPGQQLLPGRGLGEGGTPQKGLSRPRPHGCI